MKLKSLKNKKFITISLIVISLMITIYPIYKLSKAILNAGSFAPDIEMENLDNFDPIVFRQPNKTDKYTSQNFNLYISKNYMTDIEANNYLTWIEDRFNRVIDYMECRKEVESDSKKIDIFLLDSPGTSFSNGDYFVVYYHLDGLDVSVHEMTHSIDFKLTRQQILENYNSRIKDFGDVLGFNNYSLSEDYSNFLLEQRAVLIEDNYGMGVGFPNYGMPINPMVYERLRSNNELPKLSNLNIMYLMMEDGDYENSSFRYVIAGSFGHFLEKEYGFKKYNQVLKDGYKKSLGKTLTELEEEWLKSLKLGSILQNLIMVLFAIVILLIAHQWLNLKKLDFFVRLSAIIVFLLGFLSWGYYLSYGDNDLWGLVFAVLVASLIKIWKSKIAIISLWSLGVLTVIFPLIV